MDLLGDAILSKLDREEEKKNVFNTHNQRLKIVSTADPNSSLEFLLSVKQLFQKMLPKMPREYIIRQVFDPKHCCLVFTGAPADNSVQTSQSNNHIIGAICYRPAFERSIVEIIFFAINSEFHISGYGTFLFSCFKEACKMQFASFLESADQFLKSDLLIDNLEILIGNKDKGIQPIYYNNKYKSDMNLYLLTYADNSAIGFFKKQGFSLFPVSTAWKGYIKDYDGGTLMECKIHRDIQYLDKRSLVEQIRLRIFKEMESINEYHLVRPSSDRDQLIDLHNKYKEGVVERTSHDFLRDFIDFLLCSLKADPFAWPFLEPVSTVDVPDYALVIKRPIDLGTMTVRHSNGYYTSLQLFSDDINLMINNCYTYNGQGTQYYRCAENIQQVYAKLLERYEYTIDKWGYHTKV